jgi:hypothetical protein
LAALTKREERKLNMTLGTAFVLIIVFFIVWGMGREGYRRIERRRYLLVHCPEHIRDRNKPLQVGQVWEAEGWKSIITAIHGNRIEHDDYIPNFYDGDPQRTYRLHSTLKEFRNLIQVHKFHVAKQGVENPGAETENVKEKVELHV